jgi:ABC-2 type transport system ATP-binding protein
MSDPIVTVEHVRKEFAYLNPDANSNVPDMWVAYLLGLLGHSKGPFAARRKRVVALDDISLAVERGEFFGLLGPNGAGKTTLIKVISTILRPDAGTIRVNGHDVVRDTARARASLSVVPASGWLSFDLQLTLTQNLVFWGRLCGLSERDARTRALDALGVVDLAKWRDETPDHLSSGMRQRLAIAKGLLVRSPVFVLDEPTANVDPISAYQIRDFLRNELNRGLGQTIMLATHNMAEAEMLCDRVAIIDRGNVLACDSPARFVTAIHGRVVEVSLPAGAPHALAHLRDRNVTRHVTDTIDRDGSGTLRVHLEPGVEPGHVRNLLRSLDIPEPVIVAAQPNLEDVFVHYAGRRLDGDDSTDDDTERDATREAA